MASLKAFIANTKSYIAGITGQTEWTDTPAMTLAQVSARIKALLGKTDQFADPDINLADTSTQIKAIIGLSGDDSAPEITLHGAKAHVDTSIATSGAAHGITGMNVAPVALAETASAGDDTTVSRSDHVHPNTGLMLTSHAANAVTGWGASAAALGSSSAGTATTVSRGDHVHQLPSLTTLGAAAVAGNINQPFSALHVAVQDKGGYFFGNSGKSGVWLDENLGVYSATVVGDSVGIWSSRLLAWAPIYSGDSYITGKLYVNNVDVTTTGFSASAAALGSSSAGTATTVSRGDHVHAMPTAANVSAMSTSHAANAITGWGASAAALAGTQSPGSATTVSRSDHVHPTTGLALSGHTHSTYDRASSVLSGASVFSNIVVTDGIVTSTETRSLTAGNVGAYSATGGTVSGNITTTGYVNAQSWLAGTSLSMGGILLWPNVTYLSINENGGTNGLLDLKAKDVYANGVKLTSDKRLKRNIRPVRTDEGLSQIRGLASANGVIGFRFKTDPEDAPERLGLSAQAVAASIPAASATFAAVEATEDREAEDAYLGWDVSALIATLVAAVATLDARLDALESARPGKS